MTTEQLANQSFSTLASDITSGATSLTVASAASFSGAPQFRLNVEGELMLVTGVAGAVFTVARAQEGTAAAAHSAGVRVSQVITAAALQAALVPAAIATNHAQSTTANASAANPVLSPTISITCAGPNKKVHVSVSARPLNNSAPHAAQLATMTLLLDGSPVGGAPTPSGIAVNATILGYNFSDTLDLFWDVTFPDNNAHTLGVSVAGTDDVLTLGAGAIHAQELLG